MSNFLADKSYLAIGKQTAQFVAVKPSVFVPIIEEGIKTDQKNTRVKQIVGIGYESSKVLAGEREHSGSVTIQCDPDTLGHILNLIGSKLATTGDATVGYTHTFDMLSDSKFYTFEVLRGNAVFRFVNVKIDKIEFSFKDGYLEAKIDIVAGSQFSTATLKTALTGAGMVAVAMKSDYDQHPASSLVAGDVIQLWTAGVATDVIVATVAADGSGITCLSTAVTASVGALITLKPQTASYATLLKPFKAGKAVIGFGTDNTASTTAAGAYATATPVDEIKLEINKGLISRHSTGSEDPIVLSGIPDASLSVKKLFETATEQQAYLDTAKKACTLIITGEDVTAGYPTKVQIVLYNIVPKKLDNKLKKGEYIYDEADYTVEYDNTAAKVMDIVLINKTAGTAY